MPIPDELKTDHLLLLVGTNPLPNFVAATLLTRSNTQIAFLVTPETQQVAAILARELKISANYLQVNDSDSDTIYNTVRDWAKGKQSIGLNYTGGTKVMAVKAAQAVRDLAPNAVFSYLNPRLLALQFERGSVRHTEPVGNAVQLSLTELFKLHQVESNLNDAVTTPAEDALSKILAKLSVDTQRRTAWYDWRRNKSEAWKHFPPPDHSVLGELGNELINTCGGTAPTLQALRTPLGTNNVTNWFKGKWLEAYTLNALKQAISSEFNSRARNLDCHSQLPKLACKDIFEIDIAAMRGYQLFTFSCIDSDKREMCKEHLMEVLARTRQLGGDEARAALICAIPNAAELQCEIEQPWDAAGKIKVFGAVELPDLASHLREWFKKV